MIKKILIAVMLFMGILQAEVLQNDTIAVSINPESGTLGTGLSSDQPGLKYGEFEYLSKIGIPFEFFSLKVDGVVYANDNAEGYKENWPPNTHRVNTKNLPTTIEKRGDSIVAVTTKEGLFRITHRYTLNKVDLTGYKSDKEVAVDVSIENISSKALTMKYARGIDMDPPDYKTDNQIGYRNGQIPDDYLVYTVSAKERLYPLSFYSHSNIAHSGSILAFGKKKEGCIYDPDEILKRKKTHYIGDGVIYMVFDLGKVEAGKKKNVAFSYYLDDNLKALAKRLKAKDPKPAPKVNLLSFKLREFNTEETKSSKIKAVVITATNRYYKKTDSKFVIHMHLKKGTLPEGVKVITGKGDGVKTISEESFYLKQKYAFDEDIPFHVEYTEKWKASQPIELVYTVEISKDRTESSEKYFTEFTLQLIPQKNDTISASLEGGKLLYIVPYGGDATFKKVDEQQFFPDSEAKDGKTRKGKLSLNTKENIEGVSFRVSGVPIEEGGVSYRLGEAVPIELYRNRRYIEDDTRRITMRFTDVQTKQWFLIPVEIKPQNRELTFAVNPEHPSVVLDQMELSSGAAISLYRGNERVRDITAYALEVDCEGVDCEVEKNTTNGTFVLKLYPSFVMALTPTGEVPVSLELVDGVYPNDQAKKTFSYEIVDIGLYDKWKNPFWIILAILFFIWYCCGISFGKKMFSKSSNVTTFDKDRHGNEKPYTDSYHPLRKEAGFLSRLVPYTSQSVMLESIKVVARKKGRIFLSKKSQHDVKIRGKTIKEPGEEDIELRSKDKVETYDYIYKIDN